MKEKEETRKEKRERQEYYEELVAYIVHKDYGVSIDLTKDTEVFLPHVHTDMLFQISKESLTKAKQSHLPCLSEVSLVHIKAVNDRLTQDDLIQYLGELYIVATKAKAKSKSTSLTILSAERILPSVKEGLFYEIKSTQIPWIYQIVTHLPAYIYVLEELPDSEDYWYFWPFQPLSFLQSVKQEVKKVVDQARGNKEKSLFIFWLKKLQPDFFEKEIGMPRDVEELAMEVFPQALQAREMKAMRETIIKVLHARFGPVSQEIKDKLELIDTKQALDIVINGAATEQSLEEFEKLLR